MRLAKLVERKNKSERNKQKRKRACSEGEQEVTQRVFPEWLPSPQKVGDIKILPNTSWKTAQLVYHSDNSWV